MDIYLLLNVNLSTSLAENVECCAGFTNVTGICESKRNCFNKFDCTNILMHYMNVYRQLFYLISTIIQLFYY